MYGGKAPNGLLQKYWGAHQSLLGPVQMETATFKENTSPLLLCIHNYWIQQTVLTGSHCAHLEPMPPQQAALHAHKQMQGTMWPVMDRASKHNALLVQLAALPVLGEEGMEPGARGTVLGLESRSEEEFFKRDSLLHRDVVQEV